MERIENWKPIKGYEGLYEISDWGRVKSLARVGNKQRTTDIIMKLNKGKNGYLLVGLCRNGRVATKSVHRLVAETFVPNTERKGFVNHIDADKTNNRACNLEWVTRQENERHAWEMGLKERIRETSKRNLEKARKCLDKKIPVEQFTKDGKFVKRWASSSDVAKELGFDGSSIIKCCRGKLKTTGGYKWQYAD